MLGQSISLKFSLETRLKSEPFEHLIDFLTFLVQKLSKIHKLIIINTLRPKQTIQLTSCKRFDNNCYHLLCIAIAIVFFAVVFIIIRLFITSAFRVTN